MTHRTFCRHGAMTSITPLGIAVLVAGFMLAGCDSDTNSPPATFTATITITNFNTDPDITAPPIEGVTVCEVDTTNCTTTDSEGVAVLTMPQGVNSGWTQVMDGFLSVLVPVNRTTDVSVAIPMGSDALVELFAQLLGVSAPTVDGVLTITSNEPADEGTVALAGASYALVGSDGGLFYVDENGIPDLALTETTTAGWGGFTEAAPATHVVQYGGTATNCTLTTAWPGEADGTLEMPARAGFQTQSSITCE